MHDYEAFNFFSCTFLTRCYSIKIGCLPMLTNDLNKKKSTKYLILKFLHDNNKNLNINPVYFSKMQITFDFLFR